MSSNQRVATMIIITRGGDYGEIRCSVMLRKASLGVHYTVMDLFPSNKSTLPFTKPVSRHQNHELSTLEFAETSDEALDSSLANEDAL